MLSPVLQHPTPETHTPFPAFIDSTMLSTFRSCMRKGYWNFLRNKTPLGENIHLLAGGAFAAGCDAARKLQFSSAHINSQLPLDDLLIAAFPAFAHEWGDYPHESADVKNFHNTFHALENYLNEFPPFTDQIQPFLSQTGEPTTEFSFAIPLPIKHPETGDPLLFAGRFDMLGHTGNLVVILDEKTTGGLGPYWLKQWGMRGQMLGYCWAMQQLGYHVNDVIIRGVAILKTQHTFLPAPQHYPQHLIDSWFTTTLGTINEIINRWQHSHFPMDFGDACNSYGGCQYQDLCLAIDPEQWLCNYTERTWSPLDTGDALK